VITAVDTSVLLDLFGADHAFGSRSREALRSCIAQGRLVACEVVWTEVATFFSPAADARKAMERLGIDFSALTLETALEASKAWKAYRKQGGQRTLVAADFLIGAHALCQADRLLTRDRGFYRAYFKRLTIVDPTSP
jgi:predicted nucleic acid-binding protein